MMDPEIKAKWLTALRSGKYQQGQNFLQRDDKFCCLGVLCEVMGLEATKSFENIYEYGSNGSMSYLFPVDDEHPERSCKSIPIAYANKIGLHGALKRDLIRMNDHGRSFSEIADKIEREA